MIFITGMLFGLAAYPIVWFSGGSLASLVLAVGLLLSITALALEVEGRRTSVHGSPPRGGRFASCNPPLRAAA
jgi:hypothetical protein